MVFFNIMLNFIKNDYMLDPYSTSWEVSDLLSGLEMFSILKKNHNLSPTMNPSCWHDWKNLVEEELSKNKSIIDEMNGLTLEQGLVAMQYFLEQKYWLKDNNMLLKDAYEDLVKEYNSNKNNLESSKLWKEWLVAVAEGKKFDKVFKGGVN